MPERPNPDMLVLARESRRLTQQELCARIAYSQGAISKAENGLIEISEELVHHYARELRYPESFFYEELPPRRLPVTFYRKRQSAGNPTLRAVDAQMTVLRMQLNKLLRSVDGHEAQLPQKTLQEMSYSAADLAREVRAKWQVKHGPIANLTEILERRGIFVVHWGFDFPDIDGLSVYERQDGSPPIVALDPGYPGERLRFTAAHELGHILMHHHAPLPGPRAEAEADEFAAEFLMPRADILPFLRRLSIDRLAELKRHWRVSMAALLKRASDLQMISESQRSRLWATLGAYDMRTKEPFPVPVEAPTLMRELIDFHTQKLGYTIKDLCAALSADRAEFEERFLSSQGARLRLVSGPIIDRRLEPRSKRRSEKPL